LYDDVLKGVLDKIDVMKPAEKIKLLELVVKIQQQTIENIDKFLVDKSDELSNQKNKAAEANNAVDAHLTNALLSGESSTTIEERMRALEHFDAN
jgi:uncharacterized coiled-coil protein SlyX